MRWPLDPMTLMWIQIATGFMGALTLLFVGRILARKLGLGADTQAFFSPGGGGRDALLRALGKARREILVQVYAFNDEALLNALVEAKKRGVQVEVILDPHHDKVRTEDHQFLVAQGMDPLIDVEPRANPQVVLIDGKTAITGSYDFTPQAEAEHAQTLLLFRGQPDFVRLFRDNFFKHKQHARGTQKKEEDKLRLAA